MTAICPSCNMDSLFMESYSSQGGALEVGIRCSACGHSMKAEFEVWQLRDWSLGLYDIEE